MLSASNPHQSSQTLHRHVPTTSTVPMTTSNGFPPARQPAHPQQRHYHTQSQGSANEPTRDFRGVQNGPSYPRPSANPSSTSTSTSSSYQKPAEQWMARRTPSNATNSTDRSGHTSDLLPIRTYSDRSMHRTLSPKSLHQPDSYVLAMRRQRATVFCDRGQPEDALLLAKQKAAKARAAKAIGRHSMSGPNSMSASSKSRIRNSKDQQYGYSESMHGAPVRLSATEVGDDDAVEGEEEDSYTRFHRRSHSGRSSSGNLRMPSGQGLGLNRRTSPASEESSIKEEPMAEEHGGFHRPSLATQNSSSGSGKTSGSGSQSQSRENSFGNIGALTEIVPRENHALYREKSVRNPEELRRRGSVDERTVTMTGTRLFITNPDDD